MPCQVRSGQVYCLCHISATGRLSQCSCCLLAAAVTSWSSGTKAWNLSLVVLCCHVAALWCVKSYSGLAVLTSVNDRYKLCQIPVRSVFTMFHVSYPGIIQALGCRLSAPDLADNPSTCFPLQYVKSKPQPKDQWHWTMIGTCTDHNIMCLSGHFGQ